MNFTTMKETNDRTAALIAELKSFRTHNSVKTRYRTPTIDLLKEYQSEAMASSMESSVLEAKLQEFGFNGKVVNVRKGPLITRYEIQLSSGVRLSQIRNISEDLAVALMSERIRIQAPIPGTALVGIEVINEKPATIGLKPLMEKALTSNYALPIVLGTDTVGNPVVVDLATMPHLLIAGQTGSGKSVGLNTILLSLIYTRKPEECKLIMIDPKRVEMTSYKGLPNLYRPVCTESSEAVGIFDGLIKEMESRYKLLAGYNVRNITSYNEQSKQRMPYIVAVVDEMADLMMTAGKELESKIVRLAQLSRAVGIHLVLATQRPVVSVITGLIKANMPSRISYQVASKADSRVILDCNGAENLAGRGDMLARYPGVSEPERLHGAWVSDSEILSVCNYVRR